MLTKLSYSVTFPTTGRTLAGEFEFKPGFGLITGANEQGKSLIIEVVRWCLFGSSALRGKAEDYKTLRATLQFSARDQSYVVDRTFTTAKLIGLGRKLEGCELARIPDDRHSVSTLRPHNACCCRSSKARAARIALRCSPPGCWTCCATGIASPGR